MKKINFIKLIMILSGFLLFLSGCGASLEDARKLNSQGKRAEALAMAKDLLKDDDVKVRLGAVDLIGNIGGRQAGEALIDVLDDPPPVQDAAIRNLGKLRFEPAAKKLVKLVPDARGETFEELAKAIRKIGPAAIDELVARFSALPDNSRSRHKRMILAVGPTVAESIAKNLAGKSYFDNKANFDILIAFKNPRVAGLLLEHIGNVEIADMIVEGLTKLGSSAVNASINALEKLKGRTGDTEMKERLIEVLGNLQDQRAVPILEELTMDDADRVRNKATTALRKIRGF